MRHKIAALALASIALAAAVNFGMSSPAQAALPSECFGHKVTIQGTRGDDVIEVTALEASVHVVTNGRSYELFDFPAIASGGGNDKINVMSFDGGPAVACTGDGNDVVTGGMVSRISTGSGKDRVEQYLQCGTNPDIYGAETVKITGFDSESVGACRGL